MELLTDEHCHLFPTGIPLSHELRPLPLGRSEVRATVLLVFVLQSDVNARKEAA